MYEHAQTLDGTIQVAILLLKYQPPNRETMIQGITNREMMIQGITLELK